MNEERSLNELSSADAQSPSGGSLLPEQGTEVGQGTEGDFTQDRNGVSESTNEGSQLQEHSGHSGQGNVYTAREEGVKVEARSEGKELATETKAAILAEYVEGALKENFLSFSSLDLQRDYPKAFKMLLDDLQSRSPIELDDETVMATLLYTPRSVLYQFFDSKGLFVNTIGKHTSWENMLNDETSEANFSSRVYAEYDGFHKAFEKLNK